MSKSTQPINDPFVTLELEAEMYEMIDKCNELADALNKCIPDYILLTSSGSPNPHTYWGGVLNNIILTRATLRSQLRKEEI